MIRVVTACVWSDGDGDERVVCGAGRDMGDDVVSDLGMKRDGGIINILIAHRRSKPRTAARISRHENRRTPVELGYVGVV